MCFLSLLENTPQRVTLVKLGVISPINIHLMNHFYTNTLKVAENISWNFVCFCLSATVLLFIGFPHWFALFHLLFKQLLNNFNRL